MVIYYKCITVHAYKRERRWHGLSHSTQFSLRFKSFHRPQILEWGLQCNYLGAFSSLLLLSSSQLRLLQLWVACNDFKSKNINSKLQPVPKAAVHTECSKERSTDWAPTKFMVICFPILPFDPRFLPHGRSPCLRRHLIDICNVWRMSIPLRCQDMLTLSVISSQDPLLGDATGKFPRYPLKEGKLPLSRVLHRGEIKIRSCVSNVFLVPRLDLLRGNVIPTIKRTTHPDRLSWPFTTWKTSKPVLLLGREI